MTESNCDRRRWYCMRENTPNYIKLVGYYPSNFMWSVEKLKGKNPYREVRLVIEGIGRYPEILAGCVPFPVVGNLAKRILISDFSISNFGRVSCGNISGGRFVHCTYYSIPIFSSDFCSSNFSRVPQGNHWSIIGDLFCVDDVFIGKYSKNIFFNVVFSELTSTKSQNELIIKNFDQYFIERANADKTAIESKIYEYMFDCLQRFYRERSERISAILLDADPVNGYVGLTVKTSPVGKSYKGLDIDDFEYELYSCIEGPELYGSAKYLREKDLVAVLTKVLNRLAESEKVKCIASDSGLHLSYAVHDKPIKWIAKVR